jgi:hypothetical protein
MNLTNSSQDPKKPNGRTESNDVMPIFRKDGLQIQDIDWSVMVVDRHKVLDSFGFIYHPNREEK